MKITWFDRLVCYPLLAVAVLASCVSPDEPKPDRPQPPQAAMAPCPAPQTKPTVRLVDSTKSELDRYEAIYRECAARQSILANFIRQNLR